MLHIWEEKRRKIILLLWQFMHHLQQPSTIHTAAVCRPPVEPRVHCTLGFLCALWERDDGRDSATTHAGRGQFWRYFRLRLQGQNAVGQLLAGNFQRHLQNQEQKHNLVQHTKATSTTVPTTGHTMTSHSRALIVFWPIFKAFPAVSIIIISQNPKPVVFF